MKTIKKPVVVKFRKNNGSVVKFKATKCVKKPVKKIIPLIILN